jgi:hypothetical protein
MERKLPRGLVKFLKAAYSQPPDVDGPSLFYFVKRLASPGELFEYESWPLTEANTKAYGPVFERQLGAKPGDNIVLYLTKEWDRFSLGIV